MLQAERKAALPDLLRAPEGKDQRGAGQGEEQIFLLEHGQVCG